MISLVIPVYNYADRLPASLSRLHYWAKNRRDVLEILLIDDGSTDETPKLLTKLEAPMRLITLPKNQGKGAAVRAGMNAAKGDYLFFTDIDLPYDFRAIDDAIKKFADGADFVSGSRYLSDSHFAVKRSKKRELSSIIFGYLANTILLSPVADTQCGIKGFRRGAAKLIFEKLRYTGYIFDVELFYHAQHENLRVALVPVTLVDESTSSIHVIRDGFRMAFDLVRLFVRTRTTISRRDLQFIAVLGTAIAILAIPLLQNVGVIPLLMQHSVPFILIALALVLLMPVLLFMVSIALTLLPVHKHSAGEFSRYGIVGIFNFSLNAAIFNSFMYFSGISSGPLVLVFALITFAIVITQAFFWSMFWTFHNAPAQHRHRQYLRFFAVTSMTALVNLAVIHVFVNVIGAPEGIPEKVWANVALIFTVFTAILGNFFGYKFLVFAKN